MEKRAFPIFALAASLLLFGCDGASSSSSPSLSDESSSSQVEDSSSSESSVIDEEFIALPDGAWDPSDEVSEASITGSLIEACIDFVFTVGETYRGTIDFGSAISEEGARIETTDNGVCEASIDGGNVTFTGTHAGETILRIYDADGFLYFRQRLTFHNALEDFAELADFIVNEVDHYESVMVPGLEFYFLSDSSGFVSGHDQGIIIDPTINFTYHFDAIVGDEFHLVIDQWQNQSAVQFTVVDIYITRTGYACHPMASGGVLDYFVPVMVE